MNLRPIVPVSAAAVLVAGLLAHSGLAVATAEGGSVTGRVVWCAPLVIPAFGGDGAGGSPGFGGEPPPAVTPTAAAPPAAVAAPPPLPPDQQVPKPPVGVPGEPGPHPSIFPVPAPAPIPAGAVLVAVQGTSLSTRTDERGQFRIDGVPVGQYLTLGVGPVRGLDSAMALRPNVFISAAGQAVDLGMLSLPCSSFPYIGVAGASGGGVSGGGIGGAAGAGGGGAGGGFGIRPAAPAAGAAAEAAAEGGASAEADQTP